MTVDVYPVKKQKSPRPDKILNLLDTFPSLITYNVSQCFGHGTFSSVYMGSVQNKQETKGKKVALKHILPTSHPNRILMEIKCLTSMGGRNNILELISCFRNLNDFVLVMPFFPHNEFNEFVGHLSLEELKDYIYNLLVALRHVHSFNVIHRDIKPANFLYNRKHRKYALIDFGLAQLSNGKKDSISLNSCPLTETPNSSVRVVKRKLNLKENFEKHKTVRRYSHCNTSTALSTGHQDNQNRPSYQEYALLKETPYIKNPRSILKEVHTQSGKHMLYLQSCGCYGNRKVCAVCLKRYNMVAPRAGTPGFRAPEVLFKCQVQGTGLDIWSAGVMVLCLLSGRYPFFKAVDDLAALAEIVTLLGSNSIRKAASSMGVLMLDSEEKKPVNLKDACEKLRSSLNDLILKSTCKCQQKITCACSKLNTDKLEFVLYPPSVYNLLADILEPNPTLRLSAELALQHRFFAER